MNLKEIRDKARGLTKGACRVCPKCDGRICAGEVPGMGGAGTGGAFQNNIEALRAIKLNPLLVHKVHFPETTTEILGIKLSLPLMVGPIGGIAFNLGEAMGEAQYQEAIAFGAVDAGIVAGTPDAVPNEVMEIGLQQAEKLGPGRTVPFIKPWEPELIREKLELCAKFDVRVVGCDLDSIGLITLRLMGKPAFAKDQGDLNKIVEMAHNLGLKIMIKGILNPADALKCLAAGADGIVVSNHGGRVLDSVPGSAQVLPKIAALVKGKMAILADGGVRSGIDILKMLALGADAVMIGRPYAIAAIGGGRQGVAMYTDSLSQQLIQAMVMTGCQNVSEADEKLLYSN
jgi:isopentenyl diphosphate isomerase/L-lactate dehydrogenase-like FMN-dependent dehydrogenase